MSATSSTASTARLPQVGRWSAFAQGFSWGLRGLVAKEVRSRVRGWRSVAILTSYLLALAVGIAGFLVLADRSGLAASPWLGLQLFSALALGAVLLLAFITPSLTANAVSGERERRTLDLMLVTRSSTLGLISGKLAGSLLYVLFLLTASLPAFALVYAFGGIPLQYLLVALAVLAATAVAHASIGLILSTLVRRSIVASVVGYLVVIVVVFGLPFVATVGEVTGGGPGENMAYAMGGGYASYPGYYEPGYGGAPVGPPPVYSYASPLVAMSSALPVSQVDSGTAVLNELLRLVAGGRSPVHATGDSMFRTTYALPADPATGEPQTTEIWAPWVYYVTGSLVLAPISVLLSAAMLTPRKPWHRLLRRQRTAAPTHRDAVA